MEENHSRLVFGFVADIKREKVVSSGSANVAYCGQKIIEKVAVEIFKISGLKIVWWVFREEREEFNGGISMTKGSQTTAVEMSEQWLASGEKRKKRNKK
ncbi:hypothetical protein TSUD_228600 [Trifolium subterraneum]|uniref:Uncharacterized protein n=1 Tax=Trifolium subterraneum TaxID=3900 RepID=A0A2Z6M1Q8_TRISU|nr:hypothetical protein TSUD_228600 [Trifolium subterraneum]